MLSRGQVDLLLSWINFIILDDGPDDLADIVFAIQPIEQGRNPVQLSIGGFVVPRNGRHGILRLEEISDRGVVDNDHVFHWATQSSQILHKGVIEEGAVLAEQEVRAHLLWIKMLHQGLCILGQTCREDDKLVDLVHLFEELGNEGSHQHID